MTALSVDDLFTAGIGFEIAGALLLAKGILVSAHEQLLRGMSGYGGYSFAQVISWADDWVDAVAGAAALVGGFVLQAVGYALIVGGESTSTGMSAGAVAAAFSAGSVAITFAIWWKVRRRLVRSRIVRLATARSGGDRPDGYLLAGVAHEWDRSFTEQEVPDVLKRVFGVSDYVVDETALSNLAASWEEPK